MEGLPCIICIFCNCLTNVINIIILNDRTATGKLFDASLANPPSVISTMSERLEENTSWIFLQREIRNAKCFLVTGQN